MKITKRAAFGVPFIAAIGWTVGSFVGVLAVRAIQTVIYFGMMMLGG